MDMRNCHGFLTRYNTLDALQVSLVYFLLIVLHTVSDTIRISHFWEIVFVPVIHQEASGVPPQFDRLVIMVSSLFLSFAAHLCVT